MKIEKLRGYYLRPEIMSYLSLFSHNIFQVIHSVIFSLIYMVEVQTDKIWQCE